MKTSNNFLLFVLLLLTIMFMITSCGSEDENSDCAEFNPPTKDKSFGESCVALTYGTCPTVFTDCLEGECRHSDSANDDICTRTCTSDSECGGLYCSDGICQPGATCNTYCDGYTCCTYYRDPNDPTRCVQGGCTVL